MSVNNVFMGLFFFYLGHMWHWAMEKFGDRRMLLFSTVLVVAAARARASADGGDDDYDDGEAYWNIAYGRDAGESLMDIEGMQTMRRTHDDGVTLLHLADDLVGHIVVEDAAVVALLLALATGYAAAYGARAHPHDFALDALHFQLPGHLAQRGVCIALPAGASVD